MSWVRPLGCALLAWSCAVGCAGGETSVRVDVTLAANEPAPASLTVSVYDDRRAIVLDRRLSSVTLPGTLVLRKLPDVAQRLRIVVRDDGVGSTGAAAVQTVAREQVRTAMSLSRTLSDPDGDGVPDLVDNCVAALNRDQADADGDGMGDVCDGGPTPDLAGIDLSGDLAVAPIDMGCTKLLCDDFERAMVAPNLSVRDQPPEITVSIDSQKTAASGTRSVRVYMVDPVSSSYLQGNVYTSRSLPQNQFFQRAYVFLTTPPQPTNVWLFQLIHNDEPFGGVTLGHDSGGRLRVHSVNLQPSFTYDSTTPLPLDRWFCLEWEVFTQVSDGGTQPAGGIRVWIDEAEVPELNQPGPIANPPFLIAIWGYEFQSEGAFGAYEVWFDAVAFDNKRIGCAP